MARLNRIIVVLFLLDICFVVSSLGGESPEILHVLRGDTVQLPCPIPYGGRCSQTIWSRTPLAGLPEDTEYISHCTDFYTKFITSSTSMQERFSVSRYDVNVTLSINDTRAEDAAFVYRCQDDSLRVLALYQVSLSRPTCSTSATVTSHHDISTERSIHLNCSVTSAATILRWYYPNGTLLSTNARSSYTTLTTELTLTNRHNFGSFRCLAGYDATVEENSCSVTPLQVPPSVEISPLNSYTAIGNNATFSCTPAIEYPAISVQWVVNQRRILPIFSDKYVVDAVNNKLTVRDVNLVDGGTVIKCKVFNAIGMKSGSRKAILYTKLPTMSRDLPLTTMRTMTSRSKNGVKRDDMLTIILQSQKYTPTTSHAPSDNDVNAHNTPVDHQTTTISTTSSSITTSPSSPSDTTATSTVEGSVLNQATITTHRITETNTAANTSSYHVHINHSVNNINVFAEDRKMLELSRLTPPTIFGITLTLLIFSIGVLMICFLLKTKSE